MYGSFTEPFYNVVEKINLSVDSHLVGHAADSCFPCSQLIEIMFSISYERKIVACIPANLLSSLTTDE